MPTRSIIGRALVGGVALGLGVSGILLAQEPVVYKIAGLRTSDRFGVAVASVGDIDGDGAPDFVAGAEQPFVDSPPPPGYVRLISGKTGTVLKTWYGEVPGIGFGLEVSAIGDLDGDKKTDFAAGTEDTVVHVISAATGEQLLRVDAEYGEPHAYVVHIAPASDVDGDQKPDLLLGDVGLDIGFKLLGVGRASVYSGNDGKALWVRIGEGDADVLGTSLSPLGDVDGDGLPDVAVGMPRGIHAAYKSSQRLGQVLILRGKDGATLRVLERPEPFYNFGEAMANLGDLDGDGHPELAIAAPGYAETGTFSRGWVGIYSTRAFEVIREYFGSTGYVFSKNFQGDALGFKLSSAGDADGDRVPDYLLGAERWSSFFDYDGRVDLCSGRTGRILASYEEINNDEHRLLGSLSALGDLDGDGRDEFLIGAPHYPPATPRNDPTERTGTVFVIRYEPDLPVFVRGDVDSDGFVDLTDAIFLIQHLYLRGPEGDCRMALDLNANDRINNADAIHLFQYLFFGDLAPAPPFPECSRFGGLRKSALDCRSSPCR